MARIAIISPNPASRVWREHFGRRLRSIRVPRVKCHPPRVSSAADLEHDPEKACPALDAGWVPVFRKACLRARPEGSCSKTKASAAESKMPVYTVHAPLSNGADLTATDKFAFVRDGFHFWAAVAGVVWLAWHRLWLALIGWIVLLAGVDGGLAAFGVGRGTIFAVDLLLALLLGFEAA